jgi:lipid A oxidase
MKSYVAGLAALLSTTAIAAAEVQISVYGGYQTAADSDVRITGPTFDQRFDADWEGKSFAMPPYYGVRGTWWIPQYESFGVSLDFTHAKVYGPASIVVSAPQRARPT